MTIIMLSFILKNTFQPNKLLVDRFCLNFASQLKLKKECVLGRKNTETLEEFSHDHGQKQPQ